MFGLHDHSYFSHAAYAPRDVLKTSHPIGRFRWCSSAHLSQYLSPQTVSCRGPVSPWFTSGRPPEFQHYVCPVENVLGRVPLIPCYLKGNSHNTIPFSLRRHVPYGAAADSRQGSGTGSLLFEVNIWMWRYGRSFPRKVSVMDAVEMRRERVRESRSRGAATLKRSRLATE
jgi:hypothetical protein